MEQYYITLSMTGLLVAISFYGGIITYKHVRVTKNRSLGALVLSWFSWTIAYLCLISASIVNFYFPNETFNYWKYTIVSSFIFQIVGVFNFIIFVDENTRASIGLLKIIIISIIGTLYMILPLVTHQLHFSETSLFSAHDILRWTQTAFGIFHFLISLSWIIRMWKNSPKKLKRVTAILLIFFTFCSITAVIAYLISSYFENFMILLYVFHGAARLSIVIAIQMEPKIINILPFVANRIFVINRKSGILLYEYSWTDKKSKNLSLFIHGIQKVTQETLQVGELKELSLGEGLVILDHSQILTFALFTTKSTKYLQYCFRNFKESFENHITATSKKVEGIIDSADFVFGDDLIKKFFKYIPSRRTKKDQFK